MSAEVLQSFSRYLDKAEMGRRFRVARQSRGLSLAETADVSDMSIATLSKAERGKVVLSYDKFVKLARVLELDLGSLFDDPVQQLQAGSCTVTRAEQGVFFDAGPNLYQMLSTQLAAKRMAPSIMYVHAEQLSESEDFTRHPGEEFALVLDGQVDLHFETGTVHRLKQHDSVYFDSQVGHLYLRRSVEVGVVLGVCLPSALGA